MTMGKELDNASDSQGSITEGDAVELTRDKNVAQSRRRFSRNAVVGGAVLLSLGNRAAWSQSELPCVSQNAMMSLTTASAHPHHDEYDRFQDYCSVETGQCRDGFAIDKSGPASNPTYCVVEESLDGPSCDMSYSQERGQGDLGLCGDRFRLQLDGISSQRGTTTRGTQNPPPAADVHSPTSTNRGN